MIVTARAIYRNVFNSVSVSTFSASDYVNLSSFITSSSHGELTMDVGHSKVGPHRSVLPT